jgi:hypothetical protein
MKKPVLFFSFPGNHFYVSLCLGAFVAILSSFATQAQGIAAGQSIGEKIIYHDIADISIESSFWGEQDGESMDLDDNGTSDLYFWTNWSYWSHTGDESLDAGASPYTSVEVSAEPNNPGWVRKHAAGEVIDSSLFWTAGDLIFYCWSNSGISGSFSGTGYIAYRICSSDTTYGWIYLSRILSSGSRLTIHEYAYTTFYTGLVENNGLENCKIAVSDHNLFVDLPDNSSEYLLQVFDISGRPFITQNLIPGDHFIDLDGIGNGIYIVRIEDHSGRCFIRKIVVTR